MISRPGSSRVLVQALTSRGDSVWLTRTIKTASVLFVAALTAAAAQVSVTVPFSDVPFTLQPMVVLLAGLALGPRLAVASQGLYLAAGLAGLPVFAFSPLLPAGAARLFGPTGGYLLAYPLAAFVVGSLAARGFDRRYITSVAAMLAGLGVIFAGGVLWLSQFTGLPVALATGFFPFVLLDLVKVAAAAGLVPAMWRLLGPPR